jgi:hypothetical protein
MDRALYIVPHEILLQKSLSIKTRSTSQNPSHLPNLPLIYLMVTVLHFFVGIMHGNL